MWLTGPESTQTPVARRSASRSVGAAYTPEAMGKWLVERRLTGVGHRLRHLREELAVVEEQLQHLAEEADDTRIRSLVSETPLADREHHDAQRHADAMAGRRAEILASIAALEARQDALLDELTA